jgi:hypothetical protein
MKKLWNEVNEKRAEIEALNGYIIGSVKIIDCIPSKVRMTWKALGDDSGDCISASHWAEMQSPWHWVLKDPIIFYKPIPARGMLGLWEYKTEDC